ncbi:MAG: PepSY-like domain-containing protein [Bacteroidales bacterium]|nr:PepSY-like domain-containing protein [Bacteroidales bacterium]
MKQLKFILLAVLALTLSLPSCADDRPISFEQLPQAVRNFLAQYFPNKTPLLVLEDWDDYEVTYENGEKAEFTKKGDWKKIDCRMSAVPDVLIPEQIKTQVKARYPEAVIIRLKKDRTGYDIKLSNGLEIEFNKRFVITDIDD